MFSKKRDRISKILSQNKHETKATETKFGKVGGLQVQKVGIGRVNMRKVARMEPRWRYGMGRGPWWPAIGGL